MSTKWIASADHGHAGQPGSSYSERFAGITKAKNGQYQLDVWSAWGSNQGYNEEHGRIQRTYRANTLDELMRVGVSEVRQDDELGADRHSVMAAIRDAIFHAQDLEAEKKEVPHA